MSLRQVSIIGHFLFGAILLAVVAQAQTAPNQNTGVTPALPETSVPVSANAYQNPGPPGPTACKGCFPVTPAGQGPNKEAGLPQALPQPGGAPSHGGVRRVLPPPTPPNPLPYDLLL